jgi:pseudaminic acid cytidylyltransferase
MSIAVIPARIGSKRIPRKNIRPLFGKPIIGWTIENLISSGLFTRIIVSTDSEIIADVATSFGAEVPYLREAHLSDDCTGTNAVVSDCLSRLKQDVDPTRSVCCVYPTAPFIQKTYLCKGLENIESADVDFSFSVVEFPHPVWRSFRLSDKLAIEPIDTSDMGARTQDVRSVFHDAGQFYWGKVHTFLEKRELFSSRSVGVPIPRYLVCDIDTEEDWRYAEIIYRDHANQ